MKELLLQYGNLPSIWRINKYDICIWLVTNSVGILVDLDYGIIVGVGISIFLVIVRDQISAGSTIGLSVKEDLALNMRQNNYVKEIEGIKIFKLPTNLYFATAERIKNQIYNNILNPRAVLKKLKKLETLARTEDNMHELEIKEAELVFKSEAQVNTSVGSPLENAFDNEPVKYVILEMSVVQYIDMAGITVLQQVVKDFKQVKIDVYLVAVDDRVIDSLVAANFFKDFSRNCMFVDVFDVLTVIQNR
jgi:anti-anti-sigma factor